MVKKIRIFGRLMVLLLFCSPLWAQQKHAFPTFEATPLKTVLLYLEEQHQLIFSYRDTNVEQQQISLKSGTHRLNDYLVLLFQKTNLEFELIEERYVILSKRVINERADDYLCGYVVDRKEAFKMELAAISIKNKNIGVSSSVNGWFELQGIQAEDTLLISYVGYKQSETAISDLETSGCPTFLMTIEERSIPTVEVTEYLTDGIMQSSDKHAIIISPNRLSVLPGTVEPDVMTSIQQLPGVFSPNETASGIYIRGGTPDQNLVLWDGIPVYHTGHFFGMISAFNPYLVESIDVYRSGMGSEFGGRVSGVIDVKSKKELPKRLHLSTGVNMTHGHLNLDFPLWKNSGLSLSVRRSFTDSWPTPTFLNYAEKVFQGTKLEDGDFTNGNLENSDVFYFSDGNIKWMWNPGKNKFTISGFGGENHLNYVSDIPAFNAFSKDVLTLKNGGSSISWQREWSDHFSSTVRQTYAEYNYMYELGFSSQDSIDRVLLQFNSKNTIIDQGFNIVNEWCPDDSHSLKFGYQYTNNKLSFGLSKVEENQPDEEGNLDFNHELHTLFGEYHLFLAKVLNVKLGLRYQRQTIFKNDYFEPRIALTAQINDHLKLKLSSSKQFQFVSQLVLLDINDIGINNQIWIASDNNTFPVIESNQWTGGLLFIKNDWTLDLEGYVKELAGITSLSNSFGNIVDQPFSQGNSRIRGVDILLKKRIQNYRTWVSYTLSKTVYEFTNLQENAFPATHDQRHALQWVHVYTKDKIEFSIGWQFRSGLPYTSPRGVELDFNEQTQRNIPRLTYNEQNASRLKPYHRLDASLMYHFGKTKRLSGFVGLSLVNMYNTVNNLERRFLLENYDEATEDFDLLELNKLGLKYTPNLVVRLKW